MENAAFDIEEGLLNSTVASLELPNMIHLEENELAHDDVVVDHPLPVRAPAGVRLEQVPIMLQNLPLDFEGHLALFQVEEYIRLFGDGNPPPEIYYPELEAEDDTQEDSEDVDPEEGDSDDVGLQDVEAEDSSEELDHAELPLPGDHSSSSTSSDLQMQEAELEVQSERRLEKPCEIWTQEFFTHVEEIAKVQYFDEDSVVLEGAVSGESVQDHQSLAVVNDAPRAMKPDPNEPVPIIEESHTHEMMQHVSPFVSGTSAVLTIAASPPPSSSLPGESGILSRMCESILEPVNTSATATENILPEGESVPKPAAAAADIGSLSTDEAVQN